MEKTTLYLPADLQARLREAARRTGRPQADLVRDAISRYLAEQPRPVPRIIGIASGGTLRAEDAKKWVHDQWLKEHGRRRKQAVSREQRKKRRADG